MSQADLVADHKAALMDAASFFTAAADADFKRHLKHAATDLGARTFVRHVTLTITAGQAYYAAPADLVAIAASGDALASRQPPWQDSSGPLPEATIARTSAGRQICLTPAPTATHVAVTGGSYTVSYFADHVIDADAANTTVPTAHRALLLKRAAAEALRELAARNVVKPLSVRDGATNGPRNGTPAALWQAIMNEFDVGVLAC